MKEKLVLREDGLVLAVFDALVEMPLKRVAPLVARIQAIYQAVENSAKAEENPASE